MVGKAAANTLTCTGASASRITEGVASHLALEVPLLCTGKVRSSAAVTAVRLQRTAGT